jgi:predicted metal-dependent phosphoesterase TrpH
VKYADLHLHTVFSDGTSLPSELIEEARKAGVSCISIVDHDTVLAIEPALEYAREKDIEVLPGIELTAEYHDQEIHILGYLIDYKDQFFRKKLEVLKQNRVARIYKITDKLKGIGLNLEADKVFALANQGTVGRMHIALAMVNDGLVSSAAEAFSRFIGDKSPAYVCGFRFSPAEAIRLIRKVGGLAVLAHPYSVKDEITTQLIELGLDGLEVYYPEHNQSTINFYLNVAQKHNLLVTGGSDYHGRAKPEVKIGAAKIPYSCVENLKQAKEKNR